MAQVPLALKSSGAGGGAGGPWYGHVPDELCSTPVVLRDRGWKGTRGSTVVFCSSNLSSLAERPDYKHTDHDFLRMSLS